MGIWYVCGKFFKFLFMCVEIQYLTLIPFL